MSSEIKKISMRVSGGSLPKDYSVVLNVELDFTGATREELIEWAVGDRKIAAQRWLRSKTPEYLNELQKSGFRVHAREAGKQVKTREEKITEFVNMGIPQNIAEIAVDNPEKLEQMMAKGSKANK